MTGIGIPTFNSYIGIDYSGAKTPKSSLRGLRVYMVDLSSPPTEVLPPPSPRKYWTRRGIAEWLVERISEDQLTLVGIDHAFSFPLEYFKFKNPSLDWQEFLDYFQRNWPTDDDNTPVEFFRRGKFHKALDQQGNTRWRRIAERRAGAKSVFHFDVPGSVAKSTHAGLPWLRYIRQSAGNRVHFWPFDGWEIPARRSVIAEVYPSLWCKGFSHEDRTADQHDAYSVAAWLRRADLDGSLAEFFKPSLTATERTNALLEGWILGIK
jgi:hypothetical protein